MGWTRGYLLWGSELGMRLVEALPDVEAIIVDHEGHVHVSSGLRDRIRQP